MKELNTIYAISPIDGRYAETVENLREYFSEYALIKYRVLVEVKWLIKLFGDNAVLTDIEQLTKEEEDKLNGLFDLFTIEDALRVKEIESTTKHDVKAVEYFIREKITNTSLERFSSFIHFACTSEDISNLAYGLMLKETLNKVLIPMQEELKNKVKEVAKETINKPMLAHTHGQSASPTTVGKEFLVFVERWENVIDLIKNAKITGKFSGAVGNFNAHLAAYKNVKWDIVSKEFVEGLGISHNRITTQIEPHDNLAIVCNLIKTFNNITMDFNSDMWLYISMGYFKQKTVKGEVGSSVMPHKVNPINHENSMANIRIANSILNALADNLPISRMQRDLSDSSMQRNIGVGVAHTMVSIKQSVIGFDKMILNEEVLLRDLENNPEVLAEAIQTVLRKNGYVDAYEILKDLTRGKRVTIESVKEFINTLEIPKEDKNTLLELSPQTYIGMADKF